MRATIAGPAWASSILPRLAHHILATLTATLGPIAHETQVNDEALNNRKSQICQARRSPFGPFEVNSASRLERGSGVETSPPTTLASGTTSAASGTRRSQALRDWQFCGSSGAKTLAHIQIRSASLRLTLPQNRSVRMAQNWQKKRHRSNKTVRAIWTGTVAGVL